MTMRVPHWTPASVDRTAASLALAVSWQSPQRAHPQGPRTRRRPAGLIYLDDGGKLVYVPDEKGNVIPDFSNAGYGGGGAPIPHVPVKAVVEPRPGDDAERIQAAIDRVSRMKPDANGHRGAVLLRKGEYQIAGTLRISAGGVVLRGEGRERDGTVIMATGTGRRTLIEVNAVLWRLEEPRSVRVSRAKAWQRGAGHPPGHHRRLRARGSANVPRRIDTGPGRRRPHHRPPSQHQRLDQRHRHGPHPAAPGTGDPAVASRPVRPALRPGHHPYPRHRGHHRCALGERHRTGVRRRLDL